MLSPWNKSYDKSRQHIKKQRHYFTDKGPSGQGYGFSSSHVWMWELDHEESWALKNWCFWTVVLEKMLESPLDCKEIQPVHPKVNQTWLLIGSTDAEAETPILWPPDRRADSSVKTLKVGGRGNGRGWDGWMASPTWWPWVWVSSGSWWWTGRPGMLRFMGSQSRTRLSNWTELIFVTVLSIFCYVWYFYWNTGSLAKPPFCFISTAFPLAEDGAPILWAPDVKSSLIGKDPAAGKNWG